MADDTNTHTEDVVGVFDSEGNQLFSLARPIKAAIKEDAKVMEHPIETGSVTTDHVIIQPVEIDLALLLSSKEFADVYQTIRKAFLSSTKLVVNTFTGSYGNMIISKMPHDESPDMMHGVSLALSLKEVKFTEANIGSLPVSKVKHTKHASKVDRGQQNEKDLEKSKADKTSGFLELFGGKKKVAGFLGLGG